MTTLYDEYVWSGGENQYGSYDNFRKHRDMDRSKILPRHPTITHIPSPIEEKNKENKDKKITRPDNAASVAYDNLRAAVENLRYVSDMDQKEIQGLKAEVKANKNSIALLLKKVVEIQETNKELKQLLNTYNRFDIMEVDDGSSSG